MMGASSMEAHWKVWSSASSEKSARIVANRLLRELARPAEQLSFAPYPKTGGWVFAFRTVLQGATWNDCVVDVIALGQRVAYSWGLGGDISSDPEGWSNNSRISGAISVRWQLRMLQAEELNK
jgi:hypothetical protein